MSQPPTSSPNVIDPAAFWTLLESIPVCMLVTRDGPSLRARPMGPNVDAGRGEIRFVTQRSSHKADEITDLGNVNLSFMTKEEQYVSIAGTASLTQDPALIRDLWTPHDVTWFPEGPDGPDVAAICVRPATAEYWNAAGGGRCYAWLSFAPPAKDAT
jgi:general stress protein 26